MTLGKDCKGLLVELWEVEDQAAIWEVEDQIQVEILLWQDNHQQQISQQQTKQQETLR